MFEVVVVDGVPGCLLMVDGYGGVVSGCVLWMCLLFHFYFFGHH
jgi:hypothetical protein